MLQDLARFLGNFHQMKQVTLLLGLCSLCFQSEGQERARWQGGCKWGGGTDALFVAATGGLGILWGMKAGRPPSEQRQVQSSVAGSSAL